MTLRPMLRMLAERAGTSHVVCTFDLSDETWSVSVHMQGGIVSASGVNLPRVIDSLLAAIPAEAQTLST